FGHLGERGHAAGVIVDPALRDLEAVGLQAMRAVEINGPAARACDAAAIGVDAGLDLARGFRAQEYQLAHEASPISPGALYPGRVPKNCRFAHRPVDNVDNWRKNACGRAPAVGRRQESGSAFCRAVVENRSM